MPGFTESWATPISMLTEIVFSFYRHSWIFCSFAIVSCTVFLWAIYRLWLILNVTLLLWLTPHARRVSSSEYRLWLDFVIFLQLLLISWWSASGHCIELTSVLHQTKAILTINIDLDISQYYCSLFRILSYIFHYTAVQFALNWMFLYIVQSHIFGH